MDLKLRAILNKVQPLDGFVYESVALIIVGHTLQIEVRIREHHQRPPRCSCCGYVCAGYDREPERAWEGVPLWGIKVLYHYAPRRVTCPFENKVVVEAMPWNEGKHRIMKTTMSFLAHWAKVLSWKEVAVAFGVSWNTVYRSVSWSVEYGMAHRDLSGITAIGIDELHRGKGKKSDSFVTLIYQIDATQRRLLWVGLKRKAATLKKGLAALGPEVCQGMQFVCSDMWRAFVKVVKQELPDAVHMLDRFHICQHLNQAVDDVRRQESVALRGQAKAKKLKKMRWVLLRRKSRVLGRARQWLNRLIGSKLRTARAYVLKDSFQHFWTYKSVRHASAFLKAWNTRALRSRIKPMIKVAHMLRDHEPLILNWIRARKEIMSGATEGLNNKCRVVTRRSYGFKSFHVMEMALYHTLGNLPAPPVIHEFW